MNGNIWIALLFTAAAGLSTGLGGLMAFAIRHPGPKFMSFTLGFSAGVMLHVSFVELLPAAVEGLDFLRAHLAFFAGMGLLFLVDMFVPHEFAGHEDHTEKQGKLVRTGLLVALGIAIHNFPEGLATFAGTMMEERLGGAIAVAIAIHNIPEGLAVAAPIYAATGDSRKAFKWALLSGISEPVGAALAALVLWPILTPGVVAFFLGLVAGFMVSIAVDELVPAAKEFHHDHVPILGVILGSMLMAASLWMLR
jgi:ZIP family zinc transporter